MCLTMLLLGKRLGQLLAEYRSAETAIQYKMRILEPPPLKNESDPCQTFISATDFSPQTFFIYDDGTDTSETNFMNLLKNLNTKVFHESKHIPAMVF